MSSSAILIFVRAPQLGRVKTRLAAEVGPEAALRVYDALARHTLDVAWAAGERGMVRVHFTPAEAGAEVERWLGEGPQYLPQVAGDLGARLEAGFHAAFAEGCEKVVVIGSDLPALSVPILRRALALLDEQEAVLGPAADGGYYLLGLRRPVSEVFRGISWSTARVFEETRERLRAAGIEPALLEELRDVDEVEDLPAGWRERVADRSQR